MEITSLSEIFKQFGPAGLTIILFGGGLVFAARWLKELQAKMFQQQDTARSEFAIILKENRVDYLASLANERADYIAAMHRQQEQFRSQMDMTIQTFKTTMHEMGEDVKGVKVELNSLKEEVRRRP